MNVIIHEQRCLTDTTVIDKVMSDYVNGFIQETCQDGCRTVPCYDIDEVVVRGGYGNPRYGIQWATDRGIPVKVFRPNAYFHKGGSTVTYNNMCKRAGLPGVLILFWDGEDKLCRKLKEIAEKWFLIVREVII